LKIILEEDDMSNEEKETLRQVCRQCIKPFTVDVPIGLWGRYLFGNEDVDRVFRADEWHWSDREIIMQQFREHHKMWNHYYMCEHCMVKSGIAEPHETKRGMGIV